MYQRFHLLHQEQGGQPAFKTQKAKAKYEPKFKYCPGPRGAFEHP